MKKVLLITAILIPLITGCQKDPVPVNDQTLAENARDGLNELMQVMYFWNDKMPTVKASDYPGPAELLEALRYKPVDKYSFVMTYEEFQALMQGSVEGRHGITLSLDTADVVRVVNIYKNSDLWPQGVRRGWIVKKVNNVDLAPLFINAVATRDWTAYDNLMGPATVGLTNTFLFKRPDGTEVTYTSTKASFTINSVTAYDVLDLPSGKTGYLCFEAFIDPSPAELNQAFAFFKANSVTDLIIDLRYNGGGALDVAQQLASLVMKPADTTKICYKLKYNSTVSATWDESYKFTKTTNPLGLDRVVFITTRSTASASEVVISSLKPYISVSLVGDTTYGKPVGMNVFGFPFPTTSVPEPDYKYVFAPITFEYVNSSDWGGFYDGMIPDVQAIDDITRDFGDPEELSLKAAIAVLEGTKAAPAGPFRRNTIVTEGNKLPADLFLRSPKPFTK
ncbi:MAG: S41 family peptidase [Bacteroidales bacterium]